ncbi:hypothetical protein D9615_003342 [Tricholomella constricta]|uniref:Uncharacterized protein n=1 Tax=Tricholomella constricta TaxID=117010 RepID=A0A8H5HIQ8_9AGAR|nr:hypothetical protein D9615_003342 [Tricholomella constricta]
MSTGHNSEQLPETIVFGKGLSMTFLRNEPYIVRNETSADPDADALYVPPHWHETHDEIIRVVKGKMEILLGSSLRVYTPEDGDVVIPKGVVHSLRTFKGIECIFYERTDPMDEEKEIFFRNLLKTGSLPTNIFDAMLTCYYGDTLPGFPGHFIWIEKFVSNMNLLRVALSDLGNLS